MREEEERGHRSQRVVTTFEALLGGEEFYHYHSKLMMKEVPGCLYLDTILCRRRLEVSMSGTRTTDTGMWGGEE